LLDPRICIRCPLGPEPLTSRFCKRCVADVDAVVLRTNLLDKHRDRFTYEGVCFADALLYDLLPNLLPKGDPACA
jgi:hypothetical protein